jgi:hypothetical protein
MRKALQQMVIPLRVATVIAVAYLFYVFISRHTTQMHFFETSEKEDAAHAELARKFNDAYGGTDVKILQFYARDGALTEGKSTVICYGVVNAKTVTIEPAMSGIGPSLNRCVEVAPKRDTTYTLTAEGENGKKVSAALTIQLHADAELLPHINSFGVGKHLEENGKHIFLLAFTFENGKDVSIDPPVVPPIVDSAPFGQFYVEPEKTTTYTLTVTGKTGHKAQKKLTVEVKNL